MKFSAVLAIFGLAVSASAGCYSGGIAGDHEFAFNQLESVCNDFLNAGTLFGDGESRIACRTQSDGAKRWDFAVTHISSSTRNLDLDECQDGLRKEINGCTYGGESSYTNWKYKSDPNAGTC